MITMKLFVMMMGITVLIIRWTNGIRGGAMTMITRITPITITTKHMIIFSKLYTNQLSLMAAPPHKK